MAARILTPANLSSYMSRARPQGQPDWPVQDLLYLKVPILAFRNYLNDYTNDQWPLCWKQASIIPALRMTAEILKLWQAFRSGQRGVSAEKVLEKLEPKFPKIVRDVQATLAKCSLHCITDLSVTSDDYNKVLLGMAHAVRRVAEAKVDNPMLGSKILGFFFPDFFPIWDTEWIKPALRRAYAVPGWPEIPKEIEKELSGSHAGLEYARYVHLLVQDASKSTEAEYEFMKAECVKKCQDDGYHKPEHVLDEFYYDLTPMLFEVCLLGAPPTNQ